MQLTLPGRCFWPCFLPASIPFIPFIPIDNFCCSTNQERICRKQMKTHCVGSTLFENPFFFVVDYPIVVSSFSLADYPIVFFFFEELHPQPWHCASCYLEATLSRERLSLQNQVKKRWVFSYTEDIKLENFMYARKDTDHLKLIDFGLSVMAIGGAEVKEPWGFHVAEFWCFCWGKVWEPNTKMEASCGTLGYIAPEACFFFWNWRVGVFLPKLWSLSWRFKDESWRDLSWLRWEFSRLVLMFSWNLGILMVFFNEQCSLWCYTNLV